MNLIRLQRFVLACLIGVISHSPHLIADKLPDLANLQTKYLGRVIYPKMVLIPGGEFMMGSPVSGNLNNEEPIHRVHIASFMLGKFEVTFAEWDSCVANDGCSYIPNDHGWGRESHPVNGVSWLDIKEYIDWLNQQSEHDYRLPSEAEWEYAARAGSSSKFPHGNSEGEQVGEIAWYFYNSNYQSHPVGMKKPNRYGLFDLRGNLFEWVEDCFNDSYHSAPNDGSSWLSENCSQRMLRGGSWFDLPHFLRASYRWHSKVNFRARLNGFRLARSIP